MVSVHAQPGVAGKDTNGVEEGDGVEFRHKNMHLFFCLFVCMSKENFNWNCPIFKRNVQDFVILWGPCPPRGQVRDGLLGCHDPTSPRGVVGSAGSSVAFESRTLCVCQNEVSKSMWFFSPPFYIIII